MDTTDAFEIGKLFAEQVTGTTIVDGPPPPDSPLGRLLAVSEHRPLTTDDFRLVQTGSPEELEQRGGGKNLQEPGQ